MTDPIPTKLDESDAAWLDLLCKRTGLKRSEVIRRAVRTLARVANGDPKWNWVEETAAPMPPLPAHLSSELGRMPKTFSDTNDRAKNQAAEERKRRPR